MATSIFSAGTAIGAVVAVPIVAFATAWLGWRTSFLVTGLLGFLWLIPWLLLYGRPEDHPRLSPEERTRILTERVPSSTRPRSSLEVLRHRKPWGVILGPFMVDPVWQFYLFWLPSYLVQQRGFSLRDVGLWAPTALTLCADIMPRGAVATIDRPLQRRCRPGRHHPHAGDRLARGSLLVRPGLRARSASAPAWIPLAHDVDRHHRTGGVRRAAPRRQPPMNP